MNSNQDTCEVIIIGAGIIGLAIGAELSRKGREVIILESESKTVQHASSHNSEVIHSGVYYENNSLKAKFCVEGNPLLYDYCKKNGIDFRRSGKLIVANNEKELSSIEQLSINAKNNSVNEARILNKKDLLALEPSLIAEYALFIESTGIIDSHAFALTLEAEIENSGNHIITSTTVINGQYNGNKWELEIGGQDAYVINSEIIINASGYNSLDLAKKFGLNNLPETTYIKGHYYKYHGSNPFNYLIYPLPEKHGLGVHTSSDVEKSLRFGPDAEVVDEPDYYFDATEERFSRFIESIGKYFKGFDSALLKEDFCGIRTRIGATHKSSDFSILFEKDHGLEGFVNVAGIESPGLTSSLSLAKYVVAGL